MSKLTLKTEGETHIIVARRFAAPPEAVYRAHTDPKLIQKWLLGPEGWTMPVCVNDARPGGKIRYEWTNEKGAGFHITGEYLELQPYSKIVHVERMYLPDPTPDNHVETRFEADGGRHTRGICRDRSDRLQRPLCTYRRAQSRSGRWKGSRCISSGHSEHSWSVKLEWF